MIRRPLLVCALGALAWIGIGCHEVHFESHRAPGEIEIYDDLFSVSTPDDVTSVAVGYYGAIYRSADGGNTWAKRTWSDDKKYGERLLYDVSMADSSRGWTVGQVGLVVRTEDGGETWTHQPTSKEAEGSELFAVHAIDANTAWAVGVWGTRIYTDDGGASWQDRSLTIDTTHPQYVWLSPHEQERVRAGEMVFEDVTLNDVYCRPHPSTRCWIVGEFGYIFWSDDLGRTWTRAEIVGTEKLDPVTFAYDATDFSEEDAKRLQDFTDAIISQEHLNLLIEAFANDREIQRYGLSDDPTELFDILEARALGVRAVIEETGILSDRLRMRGTPPWDYEDFLEDDPQFLNRYLDSRRADQPMVTVDVAQNPYLFRVRFSDDDNGLITGLGGVVLRSEDGGKTWVYEDTGTKRAIYAVAGAGDRLIATGEKGLALVSSDGGRSWNTPSVDAFPEIFTFMRAADFAPEGDYGLIVGQRGLVLRTTDAGRSWSKVLPPEKVASAQ